MRKNIIRNNSQKEDWELLFLSVICFFSIISFWITIPLSIYIIIRCFKGIKKTFRKKFFHSILVVGILSLFFSIIFQIFMILQTKDCLGGIKFISDILHDFVLHLSIFGGY